MNTQGARTLKIVPEDHGEFSGSDIITVEAVADFRPVMMFAGFHGGMAIYAGQQLDFGGSPTPGVPFQIDWRLYHGANFCLWDDEPVGAIPTIFPTGVLAGGKLNREGMLFQLNGSFARSYLVHARVRGIGSSVRIPMGVTILANAFGPPMRTTVGSFAG